MSQVKTSVTIDLAGNFQARGQQFINTLQRMGKQGVTSMGVLRSSVTAVSNGLDRLGNRYTAMIAGGVGLGAIKQMGNLSERLAYMTAGFKASRKDIDALYQSILKVAQDKDIRVDASEIVSGVESIKQKFGDLGFAQKNLRNIGLLIRATGAEGRAAGDIVANLKEKFGILKEGDILNALDIFAVQGKAGAFELSDMVAQGNEVTAAYASMGRTGVSAVREMGAALQVMRRSSGSPAETATAFENILAELTDSKNTKLFKKVGIQIYAKGHEKDHKMLKPLQEIFDDILKVTAGDPEKIGKIFGLRAKHGFNAFTSEFKKTGKNPMYEFLPMGGDGKEILKDAADIAKEFNASMASLRTNWQRFASGNILPKVQQMADFINGLEPAAVDRWMKVGGAFAGIVGAAVVINTVANAGSVLGRLVGGGKRGVAGGAGAILNSAAIPVRVVNLPGLQGMGVTPVSGRAIALAGGAAIALPLTTALLARPIAKALAEQELKASSNSRLQQLLSQHLVLGGGPGTYQAKLIANELQKRGANDVNGTIKIVIDQEGRAKVNMLKSHTSGFNIDVDTGLMMGH